MNLPEINDDLLLAAVHEIIMGSELSNYSEAFPDDKYIQAKIRELGSGGKVAVAVIKISGESEIISAVYKELGDTGDPALMFKAYKYELRNAVNRIYEDMNNKEALEVKIVCSEEFKPHYETLGSVGMDLRSTENLDIHPLAVSLVGTGIKIAIPLGYEGQVRPRSSLFKNFGLIIPNAPGAIDTDYRGEIKVPLLNIGGELATIAIGERIAQLIIAPVSRVRWKSCDELPETERGEAGFGSTGV